MIKYIKNQEVRDCQGSGINASVNDRKVLSYVQYHL